ncbi:MAG: NAD(P)/FAD-dependent oxidoreductase [Clostridia bacterium]|nr:NAD(P)/FAD-dependent oxidoreductase [Clostridia bacterium]
MARVIITGGGVSGLSAGIYARLSGHEAVIYEAHSVPGGNLTGWDRGGYHIDNCVHWLTGTNEKTDGYRMWETLGALGAGVRRQPALYSVSDGDRRVSLHRDVEKLRSEMKSICPRDGKEIDRLIGAIKAAQTFCGLCDAPKATELRLLPYLFMSARDLSKRFSDPLLKTFISSFLSPGFGSIALIFVYANFCAGNADLPAGGSLATARRMAERFTSLGGTLHTGVRVLKICRDGKTARSVLTERGEDAGDFFVIAADPAAAEALCGAPLPAALRRMGTNKKLMKFSSVHCAFACSAPLPFRGDEVVVDGDGCFTLREYSHEPEFAPEGGNVLQSIAFCGESDADEFIARAGSDAYKRAKQMIASRMYGRIVRKYPQLSGSLDLLDVWTPATYARFTGGTSGCYMSYAFGSGYIPRRIGCRIPGLDNVLLATQWQMPPGGLPTAALSGRIAAEQIDSMCRTRRTRSVAAN